MSLWNKREPPLDPFERAARRVDPQLATLDEVHDLPLPQLRGKNLLLLFLVLVAVVAVLRDGLGSGTPDVERSCTTAAYEFHSDDIRREGVVKWSATGPQDAKVLFGIDTATVPAEGSDALLAGPVALADCFAKGQFGLRGDPGEHEVSAFLLAADGSTTRIGTTTVTVSDR